ncbi:iron chelate uptake ABC transporter family permease subunit [Hymenobacter artigasi]|uniref:Iron complex transport system permease protein n=1 Tax=Hymenobacter artigasi TaxID=2719616 RepID=A0ABX1HKT4_9BACT|nr:iron ABC transporter permease [Hymenobacter artigasi]NKI89647.1 iron complex transport system permease protein [Hymenobacter artigasi]
MMTAQRPAGTEVQAPQTAGRPVGWLLSLAGLVLVAFVLDVALGPVRIPLPTVVRLLLGHAGPDDTAAAFIVNQIRLPKALTALVVGMGLAVSGLQMQTLFRNPLAGPSVLGLTAGAGLGVALVMLAGGSAAGGFAVRQLGLSGSWALVLAATTGAGLVMLVVLVLSARVRDNVVMLIVGMMIASVTGAVVSLWQYFSAPEQIQEYLLWTFGALGGVTGPHLAVLGAVVLAGLGLAFASAKPLNALLLGENYARSMGLNVRASRTLIIASTSLLAGGITAFCGPIGFVGIAVPHLTRALLRTADHRVLLPGACLVGAALVLACDCLAQLPGSQTALPINVVTSLLGAPVVLWVVLRGRNIRSSYA